MDSSLSLRTRKNEKDSWSTHHAKDDVEYLGSSNEIRETNEPWTSHSKESKRKWLNYYTHSRKWLLVCVLFLFLLFGYAIKMMRSLPNTARNKNLYFNGTDYYDTTVIYVSLDGFRNDYLERGITPNIHQLGQEGIQADYMIPSFPSITYPNHWTLATGLYPEAHGIVANEFYDSVFDEDFIHKVGAISDQAKWWGGEPVWFTGQKQGKKSAVIMWPGSNVKVQNMTLDFHLPYARTTTLQEKFDLAFNWLDLPFSQRPNLVSIYVPQIDQKGHGGGPSGNQLNPVVSTADQAIGYLMKGLKERNLDSHVHVVVVSDHGMADVEPSKIIYCEDIMPSYSYSLLRTREAWPLLGIRPKDDAPESFLDQLYQELKNHTKSYPDPHFQFYRREQMPARFRYSATERVAPLVLIPDVGYRIVCKADEKVPSPKGVHGYDNLAIEMRAIFFAKGPKIQQQYSPGTVLKPFYNTEVYEFLTTLLDLNPAPNNSTLHGHLQPK